MNLGGLTFTASVKRAFANDVTVCGEHEPVAYVTEYFLGDGITTQFYLTADPYFPASSRPQLSENYSTKRKLTSAFGETQVDLAILLLAPGALP